MGERAANHARADEGDPVACHMRDFPFANCRFVDWLKQPRIALLRGHRPDQEGPEANIAADRMAAQLEQAHRLEGRRTQPEISSATFSIG
jgi:hypothetical protein